MSKLVFREEDTPTDIPNQNEVYFWVGTDSVPHFMLDDGTPQEFGQGVLNTHEATLDPHPQYASDSDIAAAIAIHSSAGDPHSQYLTQAEGNLAYATVANGVTNGDTHDHSGGDGDQINHATLSSIGVNSHDQIDTHLASVANPHSVTANQVGADPTGTAALVVGGHELALDPHPQYAADSDIADAISNHLGTIDPHPQYLTQSDGDLLYEASGATASAISTHEIASDPHLQYLKEVDAAATYAELDHIHSTGNILTVSQDPNLGPNEYSTIGAAIAAIGTILPAASTSNRYVIEVGPGEFVEAPGLTIPGYVHVVGHDPWNSAVLKTTDNSADFITVSPNGGLFNVGVHGPTGVGWSAIKQVGSGVIKIYWVNIKQGYYGVTLAPTSGVARCHCIGVVTDGPTGMNRMFNCDGGTFAGAAGVFTLIQSGPMSTTWTGTNAAAVYLVGNGMSPPKAAASMDLCALRGNAPAGQSLSDVYVDNGALIRGTGVSFAGATSLTNPRYAIVSGSTPGTTYTTQAHIHSSHIKPGGYTKDIRVLNNLTNTSYSGVATDAKIDLSPGASFSGSVVDPSFGTMVYGELYVGDNNVKLPLAGYVQADKNTGMVYGGGLTRGSGAREVDIAAGKAFVDTSAGLTDIMWADTTLTIPVNTPNTAVYVDSNGVVSYSLTPVDTTLNVQLGHLGTTSTDVTFLCDHQTVLPHFRSRLQNYLNRVIGPINVEGGIVSVNATNLLGVDVTASAYFIADTELHSTSNAGITFAYWHRDGLGGWSVIQTQTSCNPGFYDDGTGTLAPVPLSKFKRDVLFVITNTGGTEYHVVYGQEVFDTAIEAVNNPIPPDMLVHACRLAGIILREGTTAIHSIIDQRPRLGQSAAGSTGVTNHNDLANRESVSAHTQYQLLSEKNNAGGYVGLNASTKIAATYLYLSANAPPDVSPGGASAGINTELARSDHTHGVSVGNPVAVGTANNAGVASALSRSDHVHAHGDHGGGTLHVGATTFVSGFMSATDKAKLDDISYAIFEWGNSGILLAAVDRFMSPGWINAVAATTNTYQVRCTRAGTLRNLYVYSNTAGTGVNAINYTVQINGVDTGIIASGLPSVQSIQDTTHVAAINAGDRISIKVSKAGSITLSPSNIFVTLELGA